MSRFSRIHAAALAATSAIALTGFASVAHAQAVEAAADAPAEAAGSEIIVTGTRASGQQAANSAAPVQVLSQDALTHVAQPNLNQALTQLVPSFQAQTQGTDMASFSLSARLRGLSPNHTLVMVNGKRRHANSILQVINGAFGGSAAPSIDLIPPDIVKRIEVLQDGAAAQYGSDAIAGVINIILKSDTEGGAIKLNAGQYYDGEGRTYSVSGNFGMKVGESGYLDFSLFHRRNEVTTIGDGQLSVVNYNGTPVTVTGANAALQPYYTALANNGGTANINGGQPASQLTLGFYNAGYDFGDVQFYSFGDVSYRHGDALQGYRTPNRVCATSSSTNPIVPTSCYADTYIYGMVPHIEVNQNEFSLTNGFKGTAGGWDWDLAGSYSEDVAKIYTTHSANVSLFQATGQTPSYFYDGMFKFTQFVGTLDLRKQFELGMAEPLTFAAGGEIRRETYTIGAGDAMSLYKEGGQSFPGYAQSDAGTTRRTAKAIYVDFAAKPVEGWSVDLAGRYEHYSDFGDTAIGKLTTRYDFSPAFALRATVSTGFRAPSLQEGSYSATNVGPTSATLQLAPGSAGALKAGFSSLKPEKSLNLSAGVVLRPIPRLTVTLDGYYIKIRDRIVSSGTITGQTYVSLTAAPKQNTAIINGQSAYDLVQAVIAASGKSIDPTVVQYGSLSIQTYTNGIDTETTGLELAARYPVDLSFGSLDLSLGANYNTTKVIANRLGSLFNASARQTIESASPKTKVNVGALFKSGKFTANLRANYYSKTISYVQPNGAYTGPKDIENTWDIAEVKPAAIFDIELGYDVTSFMNLAIGANNLFNKKPEVPGLVSDYTTGTNATTKYVNGASPYINGQGTLNAPYTFGPYGSNGGYYYARATFKF
ncbi:TonB-dependent receptor [Novosphingobium flavum]|uniref:TonB-dependent receptor n=1 Tax=Novosphingobium flavum TaxID=1778672 RepID=A0A7X1KMQ0_9SPHN|nr:TonB-dependent receptor [Novosphingobium flavum]MBC2666852.1 TonB-dependent receptor [Novosphingobium flavum]